MIYLSSTQCLYEPDQGLDGLKVYANWYLGTQGAYNHMHPRIYSHQCTYTLAIL